MFKFLEREAKNNPEQFEEVYKKFSRFLKEGIATSYEHQEQLAGLMRFESSLEEAGTLTNLHNTLIERRMSRRRSTTW